MTKARAEADLTLYCLKCGEILAKVVRGEHFEIPFCSLHPSARLAIEARRAS